VLAFANDAEPSSLECADRALVRDPRDVRHSDRDVDLADVSPLQLLVDDAQILADRISDILQRLRFIPTLRPASRKSRDGHTDPFVGPMECDLVLHCLRIYSERTLASNPAPTSSYALEVRLNRPEVGRRRPGRPFGDERPRVEDHARDMVAYLYTLK
jgi:hypothetical protein